MMKYSRTFMVMLTAAVFCFPQVSTVYAQGNDKSRGGGVISSCEKSPDYIKRLEEQASKGDVESVIELGEEHIKGFCYPANVTKGESLLKRAADLGSLDAVYLLAQSFYEDKTGTRARISTRKEKSQRLYVLLANNGYTPAQFDMAMFYLKGLRGFTRNSNQALAWFEKAAAGGHMRAARQAAIIRLRGYDTVRPDPMVGEQWLRGAAQGGDLVAMKLLAEYLLEQDASKNLAEVIKLYEFLAKKGLHSVGVELGTLYENYKQPETAFYWYKIAAASGENVQGKSQALEWRMESHKIQEVSRRADKFIEEFPSLNRNYNE